MHKFETVLQNLKDSLSKTEKKERGTTAYAAECITICHHHLQLAKELVSKNDFRSPEQEIQFFKEIKPAMLGKLNYYIALHQFSTTEALLGGETLKRHYKAGLQKIEQFTQANNSFIQYLASGSSHHDREYFLRYSSDHKLLGDPLAFHVDPSFSTFYDIKAGEYFGHTTFARYLIAGLNALRRKGHAHENDVRLQWTDSAVSLVELIYALDACKSINGGKAKIGEIVAVFEQAFGIEINDSYRTYVEIKGRKTTYTRFLDKMKQKLEFKIKKELQIKQRA